MSYQDVGKPSKKRQPNSPSDAINKELKQADMTIQSSLTKFQQSLKTLGQENNKIGTEQDNYDWRKALLINMREVKS